MGSFFVEIPMDIGVGWEWKGPKTPVFESVEV
jgi:hypothetical protein